MKFDKNKTYTSRDLDKLSQTEYAAFGEFVEDSLSEYFSPKELKMIQMSDNISQRYLSGQPITQEEANIVLTVEKIYKERVPESFLNTTLNYYKNKRFKQNVNLN